MADNDRRRLAAELRRLRVQAGTSGRRLADEIGGLSQSAVSRIETGAALPTVPQVERWADVAGASPAEKETLVSLAQRAFTEIESWRTSLRDRPHLQQEIAEREARARVTRVFQPSAVPGLLQTAEYARQVFSLSPVPSVKGAVAAAVSGRMNRQPALYEPGCRFEFLITEAALRWCPGPDSRRLLPAQLDRITSLGTLENVSIGIIPDGEQALTYASHGFVIYEGHGADDTLVTIEAIHAALTIHDSEAIDVYRETWSALARMAASEGDAREIFAGLWVSPG
ncbi:MAG: Scr1 family TA system antitoxin-like transcriptional regulator [Actinoallomurus sp.]